MMARDYALSFSILEVELSLYGTFGCWTLIIDKTSCANSMFGVVNYLSFVIACGFSFALEENCGNFWHFCGDFDL